MTTLILYLQIIVALIFFLNKLLVLVGRKSGWLVGAVAALLAILYFSLLHLYVFTVLQCGLIVLMGCGVLTKRSTLVERLINFTIITAMLALTYFAFSGLMTIVEFLASILLLIGTYCLTHSKIRIGWIIYSVAHMLAAIVMYHNKQSISGDFQIASAIVAIVGIMPAKK